MEVAFSARRILIAAAFVVVFGAPSFGRTRLEHFCSVQGQEEVKLTGLGLVVGLPGTGDGARNLPTVRALRAALTQMNQPTGETDLKNADNVAVVLIEASVPKTGLRRGQKIDGYISSISAKSLRGGRLLSSPLTTLDNKKSAVALASGAITVEDAKLPNTGRLALGVDLLQNVTASFVNKDTEKGHTVTLLIDPAKASFWTSSEVANVINNEFTFEADGKRLAKSVGPGSVEVLIPRTYQEQPVEFIAQVLEVGIDTPHTQARVILNSGSKTVMVTGEVEISPVVITHKNFNIEVGGAPEPNGPFIALSEGQTRQSPVQLQQLQTALNKLRVPPDDIIAIIRELHATGKLHAELIDR